MDNNEERINEGVYPHGVLQLWLENTSAAIFYDRLKSMVMGQDDELKKAAMKLLRMVMPVTFSRFWIEAGIPTPQMPLTRFFCGLNAVGAMQT